MTETINLAGIDASGRLRPVDADHVAMIAASIEDRGLLAPLTVRRVEGAGLPYRLVAGAHRLAALHALGRAALEVGRHVLIVETGELAARMDEIDENLCRHELNPLDRALFLAERRKLYEQMNAVNTHGGKRKVQIVKDNIKSQSLRLDAGPRFTEDVAERVGLSERSIQMALRIASHLSPAIIAQLRGTSVEKNQRELLLLTNLPEGERDLVAAVIGAGKARSVHLARIAAGLEEARVPNDQIKFQNTILQNWKWLGPIGRANVLEILNLEYRKSSAKKGA